MKPRTLLLNRTRLIASALFAFASSAFAFEGRIFIKSTFGDPKTAKMHMESSYAVKGGFSRTDVSAVFTQSNAKFSSEAVIINPAKGERYVLRELPIPSKRVRWVYDVEKLAATPAEPLSSTTTEPVPPFKPTGTAKNILGHEAHEYVFEDEHGTRIHLWATKGLGKFPLAHNKVFKKEPWLQFVLANDLFMLSTLTEKKGADPTLTEVTKIEKISLPNSVFLPPADSVRSEP